MTTRLPLGCVDVNKKISQFTKQQNNETNKMIKRKSYTVPHEFLKKFTPTEITRFKDIFAKFDRNQNGSIEFGELQDAMKMLHKQVKDDKINQIMRGMCYIYIVWYISNINMI